MPWAAFARRFGEIREAGPGRRDREQVYLNPISAAETLFYRALLARAFFDTPYGAQEFAYIPEDLLPLIHLEDYPEHKEIKKAGLIPAASKAKLPDEPLGRPATPIERAEIVLSTDHILDDACTLLAALRLGWESLPHPEKLSVPEKVLREFLAAAKLIIDSNPQLEPVRSFLATPRREALSLLVRTWTEAGTFNELRQLPGLVCEGEWTNQPLVTRKFLLDLLSVIPPGEWWSMNAFVRLVKEKYADFQRPAGDYDSWFIKRTSDGVYLRGFTAWDEVDGALIRYLIAGPLYWLGMVDLACPEAGAAPSAFRLTNHEFRIPNNETDKLHVTSQARVDVPRLLPRAARYQIARFCDWEDEKEDEYRYRVTPSALMPAKEQGLKVGQLLALLRKYAAEPLPPPFVRAIQRWEMKGTEARVETQTVLRVGSPEVLEELRQSRAGRFLGESLGPVAVIVKPGAQAKVLAALAEMGLLAESSTDSETDKRTATDGATGKQM